jgi:hypothetical protein
MADADSLWPAALEPLALKPPVVILREQTVGASNLTRGLVQARVTGGARQLGYEDIDAYDAPPPKGHAGFQWQFEFIVPSLNNYVYDVFVVNHPISFYPLSIWLEFQGAEALGERSLSCKNEDEFKAALRRVFSSRELQHVLQVLRDSAVPAS